MISVVKNLIVRQQTCLKILLRIIVASCLIVVLDLRDLWMCRVDVDVVLSLLMAGVVVVSISLSQWRL